MPVYKSVGAAIVLGNMLLVLGLPLGARAGTGKPPAKTPTKVEQGLASWYRTRRTLVAAHRTLPVGAKVKVLGRNGRSIIVTVVGRGPFVKGRIIDLSSDAFKKLASLGTGILPVRLEPVSPTPPKKPAARPLPRS